MNHSSLFNAVKLSTLTFAVATSLLSTHANADAVTDWNNYALLAVKGGSSTTTGTASIALNSNVSTRISAIQARAVFDAVNVFDQFSLQSYYYSTSKPVNSSAKSAATATAQAAHDVLIGLLPNPAVNSNWAPTIAWLNQQLADDLLALGVDGSDPGIAVGQAAAVAALSARSSDFSAIRSTYTPSTNLSVSGSSVVANATGNPGAGLWRPSNGSAGVVDVVTGAPTGFDASGNILASAGIDFNWKIVTPFGLSIATKQSLVAAVPPSLVLNSDEYTAELNYVKTHGQNSLNPGDRSHDQTIQALYYKADAEVFVNEAARIAALNRNLTLDQNAKLFAALDTALADARIAAWQSKYDLLFWRPISAINANPDGSISEYNWKPLATTPSHPSSTSGHSATAAAGAEILRAFFKTDRILKNGSAANLTSIPWLKGTNNGTGYLNAQVFGGDATTRSVSSFSQLQLETGQSRIYLGVHFGNDNYQGQALGLTVADALIKGKTDPATSDLKIFSGTSTVANIKNLKSILIEDSANSGFFGL